MKITVGRGGSGVSGNSGVIFGHCISDSVTGSRELRGVKRRT